MGILVVKFYTPDCAPCAAIDKIVERTCYDLGFPLVHADASNPKTATLVNRYQITSVPTLLVMEDAYEIGRIAGAQATPKEVANQLRQYAVPRSL